MPIVQPFNYEGVISLPCVPSVRSKERNDAWSITVATWLLVLSALNSLESINNYSKMKLKVAELNRKFPLSHWGINVKKHGIPAKLCNHLNTNKLMEKTRMKD